MNNIVGIVNYGTAGNIYNVEKALQKAGGKTMVINNPSDFQLVDKIVLPGVGSFRDAMQELRDKNFIKPLKEFNKPILGICLGMQIFAKFGFEYGKTRGLGLIDGEVKPIQKILKIPHMGFNKIEASNSNEEFYFMHSYEVTNNTDIIATTERDNHIIVSGIKKNNLFGVQFHPEKSRNAGIKLLLNFIKL